MLTGVPCHFNNNIPPGGEFRQENVTSVSRKSFENKSPHTVYRYSIQTPWAYEAREPQEGNEYSEGESWGRAGALAGGVVGLPYMVSWCN
jgi:hypothetical protein